MNNYQRSNNTYHNNSANSTYTANNTTYIISGYEETRVNADRRCRGTCRTHNICTCGSNN